MRFLHGRLAGCGHGAVGEEAVGAAVCAVEDAAVDAFSRSFNQGAADVTLSKGLWRILTTKPCMPAVLFCSHSCLDRLRF